MVMTMTIIDAFPNQKNKDVGHFFLEKKDKPGGGSKGALSLGHTLSRLCFPDKFLLT